MLGAAEDANARGNLFENYVIDNLKDLIIINSETELRSVFWFISEALVRKTQTNRELQIAA